MHRLYANTTLFFQEIWTSLDFKVCDMGTGSWNQTPVDSKGELGFVLLQLMNKQGLLYDHISRFGTESQAANV